MAYLYWTNSSESRIGRADLDGSASIRASCRMLRLARLSDVAVDADHLYWSHSYQGTSAIGRANLDGTGVNQSFIAAGSRPLSGHRSRRSRPPLLEPRPPPRSVSHDLRAKLERHLRDPSFIAHPAAPLVAVDAAHIYFSDRGYRSSTIWRANIDGTGAGGFLYTAPQGLGVTGVAVDGLGISQLQGTASAKRTQRQQGKKVVFKVKVTAEEQLTANATGTITVNSAYKLKPKSVEVARDDTETLKLKPKKAKAKKIAAALKRGKEARAEAHGDAHRRRRKQCDRDSCGCD